METYRDLHAKSVADPEGFWAAAAAEIDWIKPFDKVFDPELGGFGQWFAGAECNTCYNCLDRHVERGRPGQPAIIYDSPITGAKATYSYEETLERVNAMAAVLSDQGVTKGDRVIIYMPMI
ncbi:MAG TPA: propionyl-CoA synthetase, partial [Phycisphaerales bacterium]|nr:propionyl-CoA synthetase [Phycisphaerales bacterium]